MCPSLNAKPRWTFFCDDSWLSRGELRKWCTWPFRLLSRRSSPWTNPTKTSCKFVFFSLRIEFRQTTWVSWILFQYCFHASSMADKGRENLSGDLHKVSPLDVAAHLFATGFVAQRSITGVSAVSDWSEFAWVGLCKQFVWDTHISPKSPSIDWLIDCFISWPSHRSSHRLIDWLIAWLIDWSDTWF